MAKLFYTLAEVAAKLGKSEDHVKQLAAQGQLQQFRDRDKLMFKCAQVDALSATDESALELSLDDSGTDALSASNNSDSSVTMPLTDTMIDNIGLDDEPSDNFLDDSIAMSSGPDDPQLDSQETAPPSLTHEIGLDETGITLAETGELSLADTSPTSTPNSLSNDSSANGMALSDTTASQPLKEKHPSDDFLGLAEEPSGNSASNLELSIDDLEGSDQSGTVELADDNASTLVDQPNLDDKRQSTGISVFDAADLEDAPADTSAQTVVSEGTMFTEELSLDSVGSGSGLLDLTHESDDTSLGAELLDEIYPSNSDSGIGTGMMETTVGSTGVFDGGITLEAGSTQSGEASAILDSENAASATNFQTSDSTGLEETYAGQTMQAEAVDDAGATLASAETEVYENENEEAYDYASDPSLPAMGMAVEMVDPIASGLNAGLLMGATIALTVCLVVVMAGIAGAPSALTQMMTKESNSLILYVGGLAGISVVFGVVGLVLGKMFKK